MITGISACHITIYIAVYPNQINNFYIFFTLLARKTEFPRIGGLEIILRTKTNKKYGIKLFHSRPQFRDNWI